MKTKKPKVEWDGHGTDVDIKNPGTYWKAGDLRIFTPAPFNSRRLAQAFVDHPERETKAYLVP